MNFFNDILSLLCLYVVKPYYYSALYHVTRCTLQLTDQIKQLKYAAAFHIFKFMLNLSFNMFNFNPRHDNQVVYALNISSVLSFKKICMFFTSTFWSLSSLNTDHPGDSTCPWPFVSTDNLMI